MNFQSELAPEIAAIIFPPPRTIAVLGLSDRPGRPSLEVAEALLRWGYDVVPVNPAVPSILGRPAFATLGQIQRAIDVVDVFRRSECVREHLPDILIARPRLLWLQDGVRDDFVAAAARAEGIQVVQNDCLARRISGLRAGLGS